jgi:hypothetical protein
MSDDELESGLSLPTVPLDAAAWVALEGPDRSWLEALREELRAKGVIARIGEDAGSRKPARLVVKCGPAEAPTGDGGPAPLVSEAVIWFPAPDGSTMSLRGDRELPELAAKIARFVHKVEDASDDTVQDDLLAEQIRVVVQRSNAPAPRPAPAFAAPPEAPKPKSDTAFVLVPIVLTIAVLAGFLIYVLLFR